MGDYPMQPKYRRCLVTLSLGVSETWAHDGGKVALLRALEKVLGVGTEAGVGPGGAVLHELFCRTEMPDVIAAQLEQMRLEYSLRNYLVKVDDGGRVYYPWERRPWDSDLPAQANVAPMQDVELPAVVPRLEEYEPGA